jgi:hypothetical protein
VHVLRNMVEAVKPGGLVLDPQVIRPNPTVEVDGQAVCEIDGEPCACRKPSLAERVLISAAAGPSARRPVPCA